MAVTLRNNVAINGGLHVDTWSPQLLFPAGTQDVWYDPGNIDLTWRRNLLSYSEQFTVGTVWGTFQLTSVTANASVAPDGTNNATLIIPNTVNTGHGLYHNLNLPAGQIYTFSVYAKTSGYPRLGMRVYDGTAYRIRATFNILNGTIVSTEAGTASIDSVGDGWYRCVVTSTMPTGTMGAVAGWVIESLPDGAVVQSSFQGNGTFGACIWGAQVEVGTATPYQKITDGVADYYNYVANPPVMFQDSTGTIVTARVEQPVGLILDKSQGLVLGSELVTNGNFSSASNWVTPTGISIANGQLLFNTSSNDNAYQNISYATGRTYRIEIDVVSYVRGTPFIIMGGVNVSIPTPSVLGRKLFYITTINNTDPLRIYGGTAGVGGEIIFDNVSVKELLGNHAYQSTPNSRPYLRARHNLLTYSEEFDNAAWTLSNSFIQANLLTYSEQFNTTVWNSTGGNTTVTADVTSAPDGTITADKLAASATTSTHTVTQAITLNTSTTYCASVYLKAAEYSWAIVYIGSVGVGRYINLSSGAVGSAFIAAPTSTTVSDAGNGWWRVNLVFSSGAVTAADIRVYVTTADGTSSYLGNGTSGIYAWGAQLVRGATPGNYQATTLSTAAVQYLAPNGTLTAKSFVENSTNGEHRFYHAANAVTVGGRYTYSFYVKANGRSSLRIYSFAFNNYTPIINFETNTVFSSSGGTSPTISSVSVGNGWYRVAFSDIATAASFDAVVMLVSGTSTFSYTGDEISGVYLWGAMLNYGSSAGTYQRTAASSYATVGTLDYDPVGQKPYLWFDGTDDSLVTTSINFSNTNKIFVCAGVTKLASGAFAMIAELSATVNSNNGTFALLGPDGTLPDYGFASKGTAASEAIANGFESPITNVITGLGDIPNDRSTLRINGAVAATDTADQGTGNYGNYPLYIGRRNNASLPFTGLLYNLMIIGAQVDPVNIDKAEKFVADRTGITI